VILGLLVLAVAAGCSKKSSNPSVSTAVVTAPSSLSYSVSDAAYILGLEILSILPTVSGDPADEYSIEPTLPGGLSFDTSSGEISGTPAELRAETTYTITARNSAGEATVELRITVNPQAPFDLSYVLSTLEARIAEEILDQVPSFGGGAGTFSIAPSLPVGLTLDSGTGVLSGTPEEVIPETLFTITLSNVSGSTSFDLNLRVRPQFDAFRDDFTALDPARWSVVESGAVSATIVDGRMLSLRSPSTTDAAIVYLREPIDPSRSQIWKFCIRCVDPGTLSDVISLVSLPSGVEPAISASSEVEMERRVAMQAADDGPDPGLRFRYDPNGDGQSRVWDGEPNNVWTTPGLMAESVVPVRQGFDADWYIVGLQIDGERERFRLFAEHRVGFGITDAAQGLKLVALTDWVGFTEFSSVERLWLVVGDRHDDAHSHELEVEWVQLEDGPATSGLTNARRQNPEFYRLRKQDGLGLTLLPSGRGESLFGGGAPGTWDEGSHRKKHVLHDSDGTYYLFYEGFDANNESEIGLATSDSLSGPWTPYTLNPIVPRSVLPNGGIDYDVLTAPWVIKIEDEPDPLLRWRMFLTGEVRNTSIHRVFVLSAPSPFGPWFVVAGSGIDGSILDESSVDDWKKDGNGDPLVLWDAAVGSWRMIYSGIREGYGWSIGTATSTDLVNWVESPANPIITANPAGVRSWVSSSGNSLELSDASAFEEDSVVIVRNQSTTGNWGLSRVRRKTGNVIELYHRISGVGGTDSNRTVALLGSGSITAHAVVPEGSGYRLYVSVFQPFILGLGGFGDCELVASLTASSLEGPWTWDQASSPHVPLDIWGADRSHENIAFPTRPLSSTP